MKKESLMILGIFIVLASFGFVFAAEQNTPSQVQVSSFVSVTITPCSATLDFGSGNPGDTDLIIGCTNNVTGAISIQNDPISNRDIDVDTKGTDFTSGGNTLDVNNIEFDEALSKASPIDLDTLYQTSSSSVSPSSTVGVFYFMDIPSGQDSGIYSGTLSVRGQ